MCCQSATADSVENDWSGRADLTVPNVAARLPSQAFLVRFALLSLGCFVGRQLRAGVDLRQPIPWRMIGRDGQI